MDAPIKECRRETKGIIRLKRTVTIQFFKLFIVLGVVGRNERPTMICPLMGTTSMKKAMKSGICRLPWMTTISLGKSYLCAVVYALLHDQSYGAIFPRLSIDVLLDGHS